MFDSQNPTDDNLDARLHRALRIISKTPWKRRTVEWQVNTALAFSNARNFPGRNFLLEAVLDIQFLIGPTLADEVVTAWKIASEQANNAKIYTGDFFRFFSSHRALMFRTMTRSWLCAVELIAVAIRLTARTFFGL